MTVTRILQRNQRNDDNSTSPSSVPTSCFSILLCKQMAPLANAWSDAIQGNKLSNNTDRIKQLIQRGDDAVEETAIFESSTGPFDGGAWQWHPSAPVDLSTRDSLALDLEPSSGASLWHPCVEPALKPSAKAAAAGGMKHNTAVGASTSGIGATCIPEHGREPADPAAVLQRAMSAHLGKTPWDGSISGFTMDWQHQVQLCERPVGTSSHLSDNRKVQMLWDVVQSVGELSGSRLQAWQSHIQLLDASSCTGQAG
jgi:hypothetical protein